MRRPRVSGHRARRTASWGLFDVTPASRMSLMKVTAIRRVRILVALSVLGTTLLAAPALAATKQAPTLGHAAHPAAADPHHPFGEDLLRACAAEMGSLPVDLTLPSTSSANWVPSFQITPDA